MTNTNPYQPPATPIVPEVTNPAWKTFARVAIFLHGCVYTILCVMGNLDESIYPSWSGVLWQATSILFDAMACYGIFALAFRALRHGSLYRIWSIFAWILPFYIFGEAFWELSSNVGLSAEESLMLLTVGFPIVMLLATPAVVFNFMLVSRLKALREPK